LGIYVHEENRRTTSPRLSLYLGKNLLGGNDYTATGRIKRQGRAIGIFRSPMDRVQDTLETLRHETFLHFGINLLAPGDKAALLADIIANKRHKAIIGRVTCQFLCALLCALRFCALSSFW